MMAEQEEKEVFSCRQEKDHVVITGWEPEEKTVQVPDTVGGLPVTALDAYAFSGGKHEEIRLPVSMKRIGHYAFYNCFSLHSLYFYTEIGDVGAGAFTGCHRVRKLDVTETGGGRSCFRDILSEFGEELEVFWHGEQEAHLMFPEFYEEGVENTPARILMTQVHGSGIHYRNCFVNGKLDFQEYDARFPMAEAIESRQLLVRMAMGRLFYPFRLEKKAEERYHACLEENLEEAGRWLIRQEDREGMKCLAERYFYDLKEKQVLEALIFQAQKEKKTELLSYLMEVRHQRYPAKKKVFEL